MSRIILILDTDLNKDHSYSEIQLALEIKPEKHYSECIGMIFLMLSELKIVKANLIEFSFCRSLFADKQDPNSNKRGNKIADEIST